jgi:hypothetical protein
VKKIEWRPPLPTRLPERRGARAIRDEDEVKRFKHAQVSKHDALDTKNVKTVDWPALFALSLAVSAIFIAALAFFSEHDAYGAAVVLAGTAIIIAGVLGAEAPRRRSK